MAAIESLKKVTYESLQQFVEALNSNFAIIENSPLFKGVPGNPGGPGNQGLAGQRGSQFIFVYFSNFNTIFGDVTSGANITLSYINSKLNTFADKSKLLKALNITEFVNNDILVLTNSMMLSFDFINQVFIDTKLAFNEQTNVLSNIQQQIQESVDNAVSQNPTLNNIKNIFESYSSIAKAYSDNSQYGGISQSVLPSMIVAPIYPGFSNDSNGAAFSNHKYFGFSNTELPQDYTGSLVTGSIRQYIQLLQSTIDVSSQLQPLTSSYAPGPLNLPSKIILQNDERSGILIGYRGKQNLKTFGHIFKDEWGNMVFQSSSGPYVNSETGLHNDYSKILINASRLFYGKDAIIGKNLTVGSDLTIVQNIINSFISTGKTTTGNKYKMTLGNGDINESPTDYSIIEFTTSKIKLTDSFKGSADNRILKVDTNGLLSVIEIDITPVDNSLATFFKTDINGNYIANPVNLLQASKLVHSGYYNLLASKINDAENKILNNYWTKTQLSDGTVPYLQANTRLIVGPKLLGVQTSYKSALEVYTPTLGLNNTLVRIGNNANSELRIIGKTYFASDNNSGANYNPIPYVNMILTTDSNGLLTFIDKSTYANAKDYWRKDQFKHILNRQNNPATGTISFNTSSNIVIGTGTNFNSSYVNQSFYDENDTFVGWIASVQSTTQVTLLENAKFTSSNMTFYLRYTGSDGYWQIPGIGVNDYIAVGYGYYNTFLVDNTFNGTGRINIGRTGSSFQTPIYFPQTPSAVFVTDSNSLLQRDYGIENLPANKNILIDITQETTANNASAANTVIKEFPTTSIPGNLTQDFKKFLTSRHGNFLIRTINNIKAKLAIIDTSLTNISNAIPTNFLKNNNLNRFSNATFRGTSNNIIDITDSENASPDNVYITTYNKSFAISKLVANSDGYQYWNSGFLKIADYGMWQTSSYQFNGIAIIKYKSNSGGGSRTFNNIKTGTISPYEWGGNPKITIINDSELQMYLICSNSGLFLYVRTDNGSADTHISQYGIVGSISFLESIE